MTQEVADGLQRYPFPEHQTRRRVPQNMRANTRCREAGSPRRTVDQRRHRRTICQWDEGSIHTKKNMFILNVRAPVLHVIQNGIAYILRQREDALSAALSS